jgi:putative flippase GtrA
MARSAARTYRFAAASVLGFGVAELSLAAGLLVYYGRLVLPQTSYGSLPLIGLDVLSLAVGVSASFFINERITVSATSRTEAGASRLLYRYARFQAVSWLGNAGIILVQLALLGTIGLPPPIGSLVGAVVTYPVVYLFSVRIVWKSYTLR